jgi:hypothetical protein
MTKLKNSNNILTLYQSVCLPWQRKTSSSSLSNLITCRSINKTSKRIRIVTQNTTMKFHLKLTSRLTTGPKMLKWVPITNLKTMALIRTCPSSAIYSLKPRKRRILTVKKVTTLNSKGGGAASRNLWLCGGQPSSLMKCKTLVKAKAHRTKAAVARHRRAALKSTISLSVPKLTMQKKLRHPQSLSDFSLKLNRLRQLTNNRMTFNWGSRKSLKPIRSTHLRNLRQN